MLTQRKMMFFSPIPDHLSHRNTLNQVDVWKKKICHGRSVVILQPSADVLSLINKPECNEKKQNKNQCNSKTNKQAKTKTNKSQVSGNMMRKEHTHQKQ